MCCNTRALLYYSPACLIVLWHPWGTRWCWVHQHTVLEDCRFAKQLAGSGRWHGPLLRF